MSDLSEVAASEEALPTAMDECYVSDDAVSLNHNEDQLSESKIVSITKDVFEIVDEIDFEIQEIDVKTCVPNDCDKLVQDKPKQALPTAMDECYVSDDTVLLYHNEDELGATNMASITKDEFERVDEVDYDIQEISVKTCARNSCDKPVQDKPKPALPTAIDECYVSDDTVLFNYDEDELGASNMSITKGVFEILDEFDDDIQEINVKTCVRKGCDRPVQYNDECDGEYCSNACIVEHCKNAFSAWVTENQERHASTIQDKIPATLLQTPNEGPSSTSMSMSLSLLCGTSASIREPSDPLHGPSTSTCDLSAPPHGLSTTTRKPAARRRKSSNLTREPSDPVQGPCTTTCDPSAPVHGPSNTTRKSAARRRKSKTSTCEPSAPLHGASTSTCEPSAPLLAPSTSTRKPAARRRKPKTSTYEPSAPLDGPSTSTRKPAARRRKPKTSTYEPSAPLHRISTSTSEPSSALHAPSTPTRKPAARRRKSKTSTCEPSAPLDGPSTSTRKPAARRRKPKTSIFEPSAPLHGPSTSTCKPSDPRLALSVSTCELSDPVHGPFTSTCKPSAPLHGQSTSALLLGPSSSLELMPSSSTSGKDAIALPSEASGISQSLALPIEYDITCTTCIRKDCNNTVQYNSECGGEYCSTECLVIHCQDMVESLPTAEQASTASQQPVFITAGAETMQNGTVAHKQSQVQPIISVRTAQLKENIETDTCVHEGCDNPVNYKLQNGGYYCSIECIIADFDNVL